VNRLYPDNYLANKQKWFGRPTLMGPDFAMTGEAQINYYEK